MRREKEPLLSFASLDSEIGQRLQKEHHIPEEVDAVVLVTDDGATWGSDAALRVCGYLKAPWSWLSPLQKLPSTPFQALYSFIAKRRGKWFGRTEGCPLPDPDQAERFL